MVGRTRKFSETIRGDRGLPYRVMKTGTSFTEHAIRKGKGHIGDPRGKGYGYSKIFKELNREDMGGIVS